jgi:hypothetical protein
MVKNDPDVRALVTATLKTINKRFPAARAKIEGDDGGNLSSQAQTKARPLTLSSVRTNAPSWLGPSTVANILMTTRPWIDEDRKPEEGQ